jgi:hypothetical protein
MTDFHETWENEGSVPTTTVNFGSVGPTKRHLGDKAHGTVAQKEDLHYSRTVVKAWNHLNLSL